MTTILLDKLWTALEYYDTLGIAGKSVVSKLFVFVHIYNHMDNRWLYYSHYL